MLTTTPSPPKGAVYGAEPGWSILGIDDGRLRVRDKQIAFFFLFVTALTIETVGVSSNYTKGKLTMSFAHIKILRGAVPQGTYHTMSTLCFSLFFVQSSHHPSVCIASFLFKAL